MFDHSLSEMCVFGKQCLNKLCPFQHDQENLETEVVEVTVEELKVKFDKLTEDEQYESKMVLCDKLCTKMVLYRDTPPPPPPPQTYQI